MAGFIIFILLIIIWRMYGNKKDTEDKEKERLHPGFLKTEKKLEE